MTCSLTSHRKTLRDFMVQIERLGMTSKDGAYLLHVNPSNLSQWQTGNVRMRRSSAARMRAATFALSQISSKEGQKMPIRKMRLMVLR